MESWPSVSVVIPCRNEKGFIDRVLDSVLRSEYPRERLEVLVVDGRSTDGSRETAERYAREHPFIRVLDNPKVTAPAAMNLGIRSSRGEIVVRLDAHSVYPPDYLPRCVRLLQATNAGCVGGRIVTMPNGEHGWARAVAAVTSHPFGVGNSRFRTGGRPGPVDTVACGTFYRAVLEQVGLYDERLVRNQDNELTARLRKAGYPIICDPTIRNLYYNQPSLKGLVRQAFYNGVWNVYTVVLSPYAWSVRHFVPGLFVLYLALAVAAARLGGRWALAAAAPLGLYAALVALLAAGSRGSGAGRWRVAATAVAYHTSYGVGTHLGVANLLTGRWRRQLGRPIRR